MNQNNSYTETEALSLTEKMLEDKDKKLIYFLKYKNSIEYTNIDFFSYNQKIDIKSEFTIDTSFIQNNPEFNLILDYIIEYINSLGFNLKRGSVEGKESVFSIKFKFSPNNTSFVNYEFLKDENNQDKKFEDGIIKLKHQNINISSEDINDFDTIFHEIMHTLGLNHPGDYNGQIDTWFGADIYNIEGLDSKQLSVMSYAQPFSLLGLVGHVNNTRLSTKRSRLDEAQPIVRCAA